MEVATLMEHLQDSSKLRLLLAVDTLLFRELLSELLSDEMDFEVVGHSADPVDILTQVGQLDANCVVLSWPETDEMPEICSHLFAEYPGLVVIGISPEGGSIFTCRQCISIVRHTSQSMEEMLGVIREARTDGSSSSACVPPQSEDSLLRIRPSNHI